MSVGDGRAIRLVVIGAVGVAAIGAAVAVSTYRNRPRSPAIPPKAAALETPQDEARPLPSVARAV